MRCSSASAATATHRLLQGFPQQDPHFADYILHIHIHCARGCALASGQSSKTSMEPPPQPSDETRKRVEAAKSYIENMYKQQSQNIQERYARWADQQDGLSCRPTAL